MFSVRRPMFAARLVHGLLWFSTWSRPECDHVTPGQLTGLAPPPASTSSCGLALLSLSRDAQLVFPSLHFHSTPRLRTCGLQLPTLCTLRDRWSARRPLLFLFTTQEANLSPLRSQRRIFLRPRPAHILIRRFRNKTMINRLIFRSCWWIHTQI